MSHAAAGVQFPCSLTGGFSVAHIAQAQPTVIPAWADRYDRSVLSYAVALHILFGSNVPRIKPMMWNYVCNGTDDSILTNGILCILYLCNGTDAKALLIVMICCKL